MANSIITDPTLGGFAALSVRAGTVTIQSTGVAQAEELLEFAEAYTALGIEDSQFDASPSALAFSVYRDKEFEGGKAILDLILDSGAWREHFVTIGDNSNNRFALDNGVIVSADAAIGEALSEYWNGAR